MSPPPAHETAHAIAPDVAPPILSTGERTYRAFEYAALFFAMPGVFALAASGVPFWILLYSATGVCLLWLLLDRSFDRRSLWNPTGARAGIWGVLGLWLVGVVALSLIVRVVTPDLWLAFPRRKPVVWALVMVLYPVLSVYAQNIIYRAFIFHRYRGLFRSPEAMVWASALAFGWAHVIFQNAVAILLTLAGGLIFARTYQRHRSLLLVSIEHALYGCLVFTVGLGWALYQSLR